MKYLLLLILSFYLASACAYEHTIVPDELQSATHLDIPTGFVARGKPSVFGRRIENSTKVSNFYLSLIDNDDNDSLFSSSSKEWTNGQEIMVGVAKEGLRVVYGVRINCPAENCYLFASGGVSWLLTSNMSHVVIDFELTSNYEKKDIAEFNGELKEGNIRLLLDTIFGSGGITSQGKGWTIDFAENGIFCSEFHADNNGVPLDHAVYKRRVKPDGSIESKKIDDWYDCKAPW